MAKLGQARKKVFFLDGYEGAYQSGAMYRSEIAIDVDTFETKFNKNIVGMVIGTKYDSDKPSFTIEFYTEVNEDDLKEDIIAREKALDEEFLEGKVDVAIDNSIKDGVAI